MADFVATAETEIEAPPKRVWTALTDPDEIEKYMFGSHVVTDWKPGSPIVWKGEYEGKTYEDKGKILEFEPERRLRVHALQPAERRGRRAGQLPHAHVRARGQWRRRRESR